MRAGEGAANAGGDGPTLVSDDMEREFKRQRWEEEEREGTLLLAPATARTRTAQGAERRAFGRPQP